MRIAKHRNDIEVNEFDEVVDVGPTLLLKDTVNYIKLLAHKSRPIKPAAVELITKARLCANW